jgi:hypothetical protein
MSLPKSVVRFKTKKGRTEVSYTSNVDQASYLIAELTRAALRDVGKFVSRVCNVAAQKLPGMKNSTRVRARTSAFQYWVRKGDGDLQVGIKHGTWYGEQQELGTSGQPRRGILRSSTFENVQQIREIESQYLSAINSSPESAAALCNEGEYEGGADA